MARDVKSLDPQVVSRVEELLKQGRMQRKIASRVGLDPRWVSDINRAMVKRELAAKLDAEEAAALEQAIEEPPPTAIEAAQQEKEPDAAGDNYYLELVKLTRKAIPIRKRVKAIKNMIESPNVQLQKAGLDQLNQIEGIGKGAKDKPYEPGPMFIVDTVPDFRPKKVRDAQEDPRDEEEEASTAAADASPRGALDECTAACPNGGHDHPHSRACTCAGCQ